MTLKAYVIHDRVEVWCPIGTVLIENERLNPIAFLRASSLYLLHQWLKCFGNSG